MITIDAKAIIQNNLYLPVTAEGWVTQVVRINPREFHIALDRAMAQRVFIRPLIADH